MNILESDPVDVAASVKSRMTRDRAALAVYVDECGDVIIDRAYDPRRRVDPPTEFLVGVYTVGVGEDLIEGDLVVRRGELMAAGACPSEPPCACVCCGAVYPASMFFVRAGGKRRDTSCKPCRRKKNIAWKTMARAA